MVFFRIESGQLQQSALMASGIHHLGLNAHRGACVVGADGHFGNVDPNSLSRDTRSVIRQRSAAENSSVSVNVCHSRS